MFLTPSAASLPETAARVEYVRAPPRRRLARPPRPRWASCTIACTSRTLLCEGGPHLNAELLSAGLVDELFLSVSPLLAGEDSAQERPPLRILAGSDFDPPLALELLSVLEHDSHLFLRYRVRDGG